MTSNLKRKGSPATTTLKQAGGSLMATVPARIRDELNLSAGMVMEVSADGEVLTMRPARAPRRKYSLEELLAEEAAAGIKPLDDLDRDWLNAPPEGREIW